MSGYQEKIIRHTKRQETISKHRTSKLDLAMTEMLQSSNQEFKNNYN